MIFLCIVRSFHEFHENVVIIATYAHILSKEKYRVISCDYRIKTQNIVWTQKKISQRGGDDVYCSDRWRSFVNGFCGLIKTGIVRDL